MNYLKISILLVALCFGSLRAQKVAQLAISDIDIDRKEAVLTIDFTVSPKEVAVKSISEMTITPEIVSTDSLHSLELTPVVIAWSSRPW